MLVGFGAAMRRSELIALDLDDITITQAGLTLLVRRSKTDQEGQGREIGIPRSRKSATCPVTALEAWLALAKSPTGKNSDGFNSDFSGEPIRNDCVADSPDVHTTPVFRRIDHGRITDDRLTGRAVAEIVKRAAKRVGINPSKVAAHSLRRRSPRYFVLQVHTTEADGDPGLVSVISGPFIEFGNAWYSAGAIRRIYPDRMFIAGETCPTLPDRDRRDMRCRNTPMGA